MSTFKYFKNVCPLKRYLKENNMYVTSSFHNHIERLKMHKKHIWKIQD